MSQIVNQAFSDIVLGIDTISTEQALGEAMRKEGVTYADLEAIRKIVPPETIELTEVFGGGVNATNSNPEAKISDLDESILLLTEGQISGFEIGGFLYGRWSPCGVCRKWGADPGHVQIKYIDSLGREGSGHYGSIWTSLSMRLLNDIVDLSTIPQDGPLQEFRKSRGMPPLSMEECRAKFKAL